VSLTDGIAPGPAVWHKPPSRPPGQDAPAR